MTSGAVPPTRRSRIAGGVLLVAAVAGIMLFSSRLVAGTATGPPSGATTATTPPETRMPATPITGATTSTSGVATTSSAPGPTAGAGTAPAGEPRFLSVRLRGRAGDCVATGLVDDGQVVIGGVRPANGCDINQAYARDARGGETRLVPESAPGAPVVRFVPLDGAVLDAAVSRPAGATPAAVWITQDGTARTARVVTSAAFGQAPAGAWGVAAGPAVPRGAVLVDIADKPNGFVGSTDCAGSQRPVFEICPDGAVFRRVDPLDAGVPGPEAKVAELSLAGSAPDPVCAIITSERGRSGRLTVHWFETDREVARLDTTTTDDGPVTLCRVDGTGTVRVVVATSEGQTAAEWP